MYRSAYLRFPSNNTFEMRQFCDYHVNFVLVLIMVFDPYDGSNIRNRDIFKIDRDIPRPDREYYDWLEVRNREMRKKDATEKENTKPLIVRSVGRSRYTHIGSTGISSSKGLRAASEELLGSNKTAKGMQRRYNDPARDLIEQLAERLASRQKEVISVTASNYDIGPPSMPPFYTRELTPSEGGFTVESSE